MRAARYRVCRSLTGFDIVEPLSVNQQRTGKQAEQIPGRGEVPKIRSPRFPRRARANENANFQFFDSAQIVILRTQTTRDPSGLFRPPHSFHAGIDGELCSNCPAHKLQVSVVPVTPPSIREHAHIIWCAFRPSGITRTARRCTATSRRARPRWPRSRRVGGGSRRHEQPRRRAGPVSGAGMGDHLHHPAGRGGGHICTCPYSLEREAAMEASAKNGRLMVRRTDCGGKPCPT